MMEGIVEINESYYYVCDDEQPYGNAVRVYPAKRGIIEEERTGYDSFYTESVEWTVFEDEDGQFYSVREGKAWVKSIDEFETTLGDVEEVQYFADIDVDDEHTFVEQNLDI